MRFVIIAALCLLTAGNGSASDLKFKFDQPIKIAGGSKLALNPDIAWNGSKFAIVFDNFRYGATSSRVYLMFVGADGKITRKPKKISTGKVAVHPKIIWTGKEFAVLYASGKKERQRYNMSYYLERLTSAGKRLSREKLQGGFEEDYQPRDSVLIWTGKNFGIFYKADPQGTERPFQLFCKADSSGVPDETVRQYDYLGENLAIGWDGTRYIVFSGRFSSFTTEGCEMQLMFLDADGEELSKKQFTHFSEANWFSGVGLIPLKKNKVLLVAGIQYPLESVSFAAVRSDFFTSTVRIKKNSIGVIKFKNATKALEEGWKYPEGFAHNNKYYVGGGHGCGIGIAEVSAKGKVLKHLTYSPPVA